MRVLVTGATGFVGGHAVCALQAAGHELAAIARPGSVLPGIQVIEGDLDNTAALLAPIREFAPEAYLHLAWSGIPDFSAAACKKNVDQSIAFIDLMAGEAYCKKWLISGTCAEYGAATGRCDESKRVEASSYLGWAKQTIGQYAALRGGDKLYWFRLFYVYGPGQRKDSLIPSLTTAFRSGTGPSLRTPDVANDFVHVRDVAAAFAAALTAKAKPGVYNIAAGKAVAVREVCRLIEREVRGGDALTRKLPKSKAPGSKRRFWGGFATIRSGLGWKPRVSLADGIRDYLGV
jgi:dTDP-6-deoxy-L-talose 4-dehydrogenase (NAD+)